VSHQLTKSLRAAAPSVIFPPTPNLADEMRFELDSTLPTHHSRPLRALTLMFVLAVTAGAAALGTSNGARSAVIDLLGGVPGIEIRRTYDLPTRSVLLAAPPEFGQSVSLEEARRRSGFSLRLPAALPEPDAVHIDEGASAVAVTTVYDLVPGGAAVIITQWHPSVLLFRKLMRSPDSLVRRVNVEGGRGLWIAGGDHEVFYLGMDRRSHRGAPYLAGAALVWHRDRVTYRLEGDFTLDNALGLARSFE
jgi:hypothetical protein